MGQTMAPFLFPYQVNEPENIPSNTERVVSVYPAEEMDVVVMPAVTVDSTDLPSAEL